MAPSNSGNKWLRISLTERLSLKNSMAAYFLLFLDVIAISRAFTKSACDTHKQNPGSSVAMRLPKKFFGWGLMPRAHSAKTDVSCTYLSLLTTSHGTVDLRLSERTNERKWRRATSYRFHRHSHWKFMIHRRMENGRSSKWPGQTTRWLQR